MRPSIPELEALAEALGPGAQQLLNIVMPDVKLARRKRAEHARYMRQYRSEPSREPSRNSVSPHVSGKKERKKDLTLPLTDLSEEGPVLERARARKLPNDWCPRPQDWETSDGAELAKFKDHWRSNGKTKVDWDATWRNWKRRAPEFKSNGGYSNGGRRAGSLLDAIDQSTDWEAARNYIPGSQGPTKPEGLDKLPRFSGIRSLPKG